MKKHEEMVEKAKAALTRTLNALGEMCYCRSSEVAGKADVAREDVRQVLDIVRDLAKEYVTPHTFDNPRPPMLPSHDWLQIVAAGCSQHAHVDYAGCQHKYGWACDECPVMQRALMCSREMGIRLRQLAALEWKDAHPGETPTNERTGEELATLKEQDNKRRADILAMQMEATQQTDYPEKNT